MHVRVFLGRREEKQQKSFLTSPGRPGDPLKPAKPIQQFISMQEKSDKMESRKLTYRPLSQFWQYPESQFSNFRRYVPSQKDHVCGSEMEVNDGWGCTRGFLALERSNWAQQEEFHWEGWKH